MPGARPPMTQANVPLMTGATANAGPQVGSGSSTPSTFAHYMPVSTGIRQESLDSSVGILDKPEKLAWIIGWLCPLLVILLALFFENGGLYSSTAVYVRWMDELSARIEVVQHSNSSVFDFRLHDPLQDLLWGLKELTLPEMSWGPILVEVLTTVISIIWLAWVARMQHLELWTKLMLSGALLAFLKGVLAWVTVLPDAAGWHGCKERLGEGGLAYFRERAGGPAEWGISWRSLQASALLWPDMATLFARNLWMLGRVKQHTVCADTIFSSPTSFCLLFAAGLYDVVRADTESLEVVRRGAVRSFVGLALGFALLADLAVTALSSDHYTADILAAFPLTLLIYSNPVIAVASKRWVDCCAQGVQPLLPLYSSSSIQSTEPPTQISMDQLEPSGAAPLRDVGHAIVPPCCFPFCPFSGLYFIREQPGSKKHRPWTEACDLRQQDLVEQHRALREEKTARQRKLLDNINKVQRHSDRKSAQAADSHEPRIAAEVKKLQAERERLIAEEQARLQAQQQAVAQAEVQVTAQLRHFATVEAQFQEFQAQQLDEMARIRQSTVETQVAIIQQQPQKQRQARELALLRDIAAEFHLKILEYEQSHSLKKPEDEAILDEIANDEFDAKKADKPDAEEQNEERQVSDDHQEANRICNTDIDKEEVGNGHFEEHNADHDKFGDNEENESLAHGCPQQFIVPKGAVSEEVSLNEARNARTQHAFAEEAVAEEADNEEYLLPATLDASATMDDASCREPPLPASCEAPTSIEAVGQEVLQASQESLDESAIHQDAANEDLQPRVDCDLQQVAEAEGVHGAPSDWSKEF
mmetsp:Transcript_69396/g.137199  ORF Transcript_69396/g.137199 Transcript_69396/m.137199 type:complete len:816 (+) Transcript_69396:35-2482(+)|eukprot:CAMPEP_0172819130 /NCGR_PEP_ID=MMETSP1075-20121228/14382_1 /TAXON_ID=2916 /ORGANISM="Ceratium fusus, Strain PA161109" /LENGTH=815 /DNA_ID=CAMNT_0013659597 /DNA_START=25 /DNA_END=2472 /DNA_ORIENTATION=-